MADLVSRNELAQKVLIRLYHSALGFRCKFGVWRKSAGSRSVARFGRFVDVL